MYSSRGYGCNNGIDVLIKQPKDKPCMDAINYMDDQMVKAIVEEQYRNMCPSSPRMLDKLL